MRTRKIIKLIHKSTIIYCLFLFTGYINNIYSSSSKTISAEISINQIEYKELIHKYFPNFVLIDIDDLEPYARDCFRSYYPSLSPSLVYRDFNGNGYLDFALLLKNSKKKDDKIIFAIFLQINCRQFNLEFNLEIDSDYVDNYILPIKPGTILTESEALPGPGKKVKLKYAAIKLIYFETSSVVYYWDDKTKKFKEIWTSD
jgi:hypothetical protein